jgi:hypothetical protein
MKHYYSGKALLNCKPNWYENSWKTGCLSCHNIMILKSSIFFVYMFMETGGRDLAVNIPIP